MWRHRSCGVFTPILAHAHLLTPNSNGVGGHTAYGDSAPGFRSGVLLLPNLLLGFRRGHVRECKQGSLGSEAGCCSSPTYCLVPVEAVFGGVGWVPWVPKRGVAPPQFRGMRSERRKKRRNPAEPKVEPKAEPIGA